MPISHSLDLERDSSQYSSRADTATLSPTGDFTIECWVKVESAPGVDETRNIISKWNDGASKKSYWLFYINDAGTPKIFFRTSADGSAVTTSTWTTTLTAGVWYHLAVAYDATANDAELFIDTVSQGAVAAADSIHDNDSVFEVGVITSLGNNFWDGLLNSVRLWGDFRTSTEIANNWKTSTPTGDNLSGSWYYNEDHNDDSANGNNLTASGSPTFTTDIPYQEAGGRSYGFFM